MPGKPAARLGDAMVHGGVITGPGIPMVLIGGAPAAVMGDMHTCPQVNPGPPAIPHVGGPVMATAALVLIGGKPAARVGDTATCTGPPDMILAGCPTVLIGDSGGGGGGGAGTGSAADAKASGESSEVEENHYLDVKFVDKGGKPITGVKYSVEGPSIKKGEGTLTEKVKKSGLKEGSYEIALKAVTNAEWSEKKARVGDTVKLTAEISGFESGTEAEFMIFEKDISSADDLIETLEAKTSGDKVEVDWEYKYVEDTDDVQTAKEQKLGYSMPEYYFIVIVVNALARSGILEFRDYVEVGLKDAEGNGVADAAFRLIFGNGQIVEDTLDSNGYKKVENIPPGEWSVEFPETGPTTLSSD
jgi:uncharacterized Zn-binding protein involved in type VI secretion